MMSKTKCIALLITLSFQAVLPMHRGYPRPVHYHHADNGAAEVGKAIIGIGCLAAVGYGLYRFFDWLFSKTNEQVLKEGAVSLETAHTRYDSLIAMIAAGVGSIPAKQRDQDLLIRSVNEELLYECALKNYRKETIESLLQNLSYTISDLHSAHQMVNNRLNSLYKKRDCSEAFIVRMEALEKDLANLLVEIQFIHNYLAHHKSFFMLFETEAQLIADYEFELATINSNPGMPYIKEALRACVMRTASHSRMSYPYMQYIDRVQAAYNRLDKALNTVAYNYSNRITAARSLVQKLSMIYNLLIVEDAYHQELRDYKKEQLERERIAAEKAQAAALQQQANAMHHQNALHAQQIRVDQERNAIMATNTIINAINPPQPTYVHVYT